MSRLVCKPAGWGLTLAFAAFVGSAAEACGGRLHIELTEPGVYGLDYATIVAAQPALADCRADRLVLSHGAEEVPIRIVGGSADGWGPGARIEWLGERLHGPQSWFDPYSAVNVYQLGAAPGAHARLRTIAAADRAVAPARLHRQLHFERENLMIRLGSDQMKPGDEPDVFQWAKLTPIDAQPFSFAFDLPDADLRGTHIPLTLNFRGASRVPEPPHEAAKPVDHVVEVTLNGVHVATLSWDGRDEIRRTVEVPSALLKAEANTLGLRVPRRSDPLDARNFLIDVVMFNWAELSYPIHGDLQMAPTPFTATAAAPIELVSDGAAELFGSDGTVRLGRALGGRRYRFAAAGDDVVLFPFTGRPLAPERVRAVAPGDLRIADPGHEYLIVAHPRLLSAIAPLAAYHRAHGLDVATIDVEAIYDQFNGGIVHPRAIRDFVAWAWQHWPRRPRYLLLVGDASFDIHHDLRHDRPNARLYALRPDPFRDELLQPDGLSSMGTSAYARVDPTLPNRNLIPTFQYPAPEGQGASDNGFVAIEPGSDRPRLAVGRLPVIEPAEVEAIVAKTIAYLEHRDRGAWQRHVTLISTSELASFKGDSDRIAADLERRGFVVDNVYTAFDEKDAARYQDARVRLKQDLDQGNLLVHFLGHGGQFIWRVGPIGDLFTLADVDALGNLGKYPMVLSMTCFSAPFDHPTEDSIGERFLRDPDKGAIAVFAASWMNWPDPSNSRALIGRLLTPGVTIGDAIVAVKNQAADPVFVQTYNLLGDPAVPLALPERSLRLAVERDRWQARVLVGVPALDFGGEVEVNWVDGKGAVVQTRHYQARDTLFSLPIPSDAAVVQVFVQDGRQGWTAFGGLDLTTPPPARAAQPRPIRLVPRPRTAPAADTIARDDFDGD